MSDAMMMGASQEFILCLRDIDLSFDCHVWWRCGRLYLVRYFQALLTKQG